MLKFNLQLLATVVNDAVRTTSPDSSAASGSAARVSNVTNEIKEYYDRVLLEYAGPNLIHDQFAKKANIPVGNGKTIEWRRLVDLSTDIGALTLSEGTIPDGQSISIDHVTSTIGEYGGYIKLTDTLAIVAFDDLQTGYAKKLAQQAAKISDKLTREKMLETSYVMNAGSKAAPSAIAATDTIKLDDVFKAAATLAAVDAPTIDGSYVAIVHPYVAYDLMREAGSGWLDVMKYADPSKILNGEVGKIGNVRFVQTSMAKTYAANTDMVWNNNGTITTIKNETVGLCVTFFLGDEAYASVSLANGGIESINHDKHQIGGPLDQFSTMGWKLRKAVAILADRYLIKYYSATKAATVTTN